jgi:hypothetical protein
LPENDAKTDQTADADIRVVSHSSLSLFSSQLDFIYSSSSMSVTYSTYMSSKSTYVWDCFLLKLSYHTSKRPALTLHRRSRSTAERAPVLSNHVNAHCGVLPSLLSESPMSVGVCSFFTAVSAWAEFSFVLFSWLMTDDKNWVGGLTLISYQQATKGQRDDINSPYGYYDNEL